MDPDSFDLIQECNNCPVAPPAQTTGQGYSIYLKFDLLPSGDVYTVLSCWMTMFITQITSMLRDYPISHSLPK